MNSIDLETVRRKIEDVRSKDLSNRDLALISISLAEDILACVEKEIRPSEKKDLLEIHQVVSNDNGKAFVVDFLDQSFRSKRPKRVANQIAYLLNRDGVPSFIPLYKRVMIHLLKKVGQYSPALFVKSVEEFIRHKLKSVVISAEDKPLQKYLTKRKEEGFEVNINHLGEAILGEDEALSRLNEYLVDLENPLIDQVSIKISTLFSQISPLSYEETVEYLKPRYRQLLRKAKEQKKMVHLDMEEWKDLHLTCDLFKQVLSEAEFNGTSAGIVLQSYLPESYSLLIELMDFAKGREAPLQIRIVKGANLAQERVEADIRKWHQAPYLTKVETDANFKRMLLFALSQEYKNAVHIGVGSHNLFDITFALLLSINRNVEEMVAFEMLEGMHSSLARVMQNIHGPLRLYCPIVKDRDFNNAVAYLMRRLDENSGKDNFLRHIFSLKPGSKAWKDQSEQFLNAFTIIDELTTLSQRGKDLFHCCSTFQNCSDLDFALAKNRKGIVESLKKWEKMDPGQIPLCIADKFVTGAQEGKGITPSRPTDILYTYALADKSHVLEAVESSKRGLQQWQKLSLVERLTQIKAVTDLLEEKRKDLIGAMVLDVGKSVEEADGEVSEAIDFGNYYAYMMEEWSSIKNLQFTAKGPILVASPWNFPLSIAAGGIFAALCSGNSVIFKPAPESVLVGWELVKIFWQAGVSKETLQFITGEDDVVGVELVQDKNIAAMILTGGSDTALKVLQLRPGIDLFAETGGKNSLIVTSLADRDLAVKDALQSAFGFNGQKCSALSLLILEDEVYSDPHFKKQLLDGAKSLIAGSSFDLKSKITPLIHEPSGPLLKAIMTLEPGEEWLLEPTQDLNNPHLLTPGIKWGVSEGSYTHTTELFGPILAVMRAKNLNHALSIANGTAYGLTAGIHTLDDREKAVFIDKMRAGNLYINRTITGALVQRQPFGGCKASSFGFGSKAGGPNYLLQFMKIQENALPVEKETIPQTLSPLMQFVNQGSFSKSEKKLFETSVENYSYYWTHYFSKKNDSSQVLGQNNFLCYGPHHFMVFRLSKGDAILDLLRAAAACHLTKTAFEVTIDPFFSGVLPTKKQLGAKEIFIEDEEAFLNRMGKGSFQRVRLFSPPNQKLLEVAAKSAMQISSNPVLAHGRIELLTYLREISISDNIHRFGYIKGYHERHCGRICEVKS